MTTRALGRVLAGSYVAAFLAFIMLPVASLVIFSFQATNVPVPPFSGPSLRWYRELFADERMMAALGNSVQVGLVSALLCTALAFLAAYGIARHRPRWGAAVRALLMTPLGVSYLVIGFGLSITANTLLLDRSLWLVILGHVVINLPLAFAVILAALREEDAQLERAARDLGAPEAVVLLRIAVPLAAPGIIAAFLLSFTLSWDEFIIAFLLAGFEVTLPVEIWSSLRTGLDAQTNAAGTLVFAISVVALVAASLIVGVLRGRRR